ncbi:UNVERIFIED_CONTAM: hypothetical protein Sangu_2868300 [Sesamum angustifolium]|uniref:Uncharacterized protein n=1 Tax=Sesamum angustifolium TaxID=2727405 RepID=A0AAW2IPG0_9LAMI
MLKCWKTPPSFNLGGAEQSGPKAPCNDALVITILLANNKVRRVFIDSGSSADILFGETYDEMQLGNIPLEAVDTSLYEFVGEVVHPRGMISLPLTLGIVPFQKTCLLKLSVVDIPSAYSVILGHPTFNTFQAIISTYHMKIKVLVAGGVGQVQADPLQSRKCYIKDIKKVKKRSLKEIVGEEYQKKRGKDPVLAKSPKRGGIPLIVYNLLEYVTRKPIGLAIFGTIQEIIIYIILS